LEGPVTPGETAADRLEPVDTKPRGKEIGARLVVSSERYEVRGPEHA
jgi:hypothetical protein